MDGRYSGHPHPHTREVIYTRRKSGPQPIAQGQRYVGIL